MILTRRFPKFSAPFAWLSLAVCLLLAGAGEPALAADEARPPEATLHYHFRPIVTFRASFVGATPEHRVRRALSRIDALPPGQMELAIEQTPFSIENRRGINLHIGEWVLFNVLEGDLDPEEKISLEELARRSAGELSAALQAASAQRRPMVVLTGVGLSLLATALALVLLWLIRRATAWMVGHFQQAVEAHPESSAFRWARYAWLLVQRVAQLLMGFLWLSVAYLWLTFVLARFPITEPLGDRLTDFLFGLLDTLGSGILGAIPALTTAVVILFLTKAFNDAIGNFFKAARAGRVQVPGLHPETVNATHRIVTIVVWGLGIAIAYPFIPMSDSDAFRGLSVMFGFMLTLGSAGIVNQLMSGLVLVYSRALSVGDFVDLGETVGVRRSRRDRRRGQRGRRLVDQDHQHAQRGSDDSQRGSCRQLDQELLAAGWRARHPGVHPGDHRLRHAVAPGACHADRGRRTDTRPADHPEALRLPARPGRLVRRIRTLRSHGQTTRASASIIGTARQHSGPVQYLRGTDHVAAFRHAAWQQRGGTSRALARTTGNAGCLSTTGLTPGNSSPASPVLTTWFHRPTGRGFRTVGTSTDPFSCLRRKSR